VAGHRHLTGDLHAGTEECSIFSNETKREVMRKEMDCGKSTGKTAEGREE